MTKIKKHEFSTEFIKQFNSLLNSKYEVDEMKYHRVVNFYRCTFNIWYKWNSKMKMETTITKLSLPELEAAIIAYVK